MAGYLMRCSDKVRHKLALGTDQASLLLESFEVAVGNCQKLVQRVDIWVRVSEVTALNQKHPRQVGASENT